MFEANAFRQPELAGPLLFQGPAQKQGAMLRISIVESSIQLARLRLEGHIIGPWVEALRRICDGELSDDKQLIVDLADVSFVDRDGVALLAMLTNRQVALVNTQPFVAELLKSGRGEAKVGPEAVERRTGRRRNL